MSTTYTVQELAQQYAEALRQDVLALREARDVMYAAQLALNEACQRQAQMNYA